MDHPTSKLSYSHGSDTNYDSTWTVKEALSTYGQDIGERSFQFALRSIGVSTFVQRHSDPAGKTLANQLLRSATLIGANVEEAQVSESRSDFIHKMKIAQKEARETFYWLRLLRTAGLLDSEKSNSIFQEADEILRVISKIIINTKANSK